MRSFQSGCYINTVKVWTGLKCLGMGSTASYSEYGVTVLLVQETRPRAGRRLCCSIRTFDCLQNPATPVYNQGQKISELDVLHGNIAAVVIMLRTWFCMWFVFNPLTPELNPSAQRCLTIFFTGDFASWTVHFVNVCVKSQQMQQLFIQFINYVWYLLHVSALHCHPQGARAPHH
jgi:hypothetical protein